MIDMRKTYIFLKTIINPCLKKKTWYPLHLGRLLWLFPVMQVDVSLTDFLLTCEPWSSPFVKYEHVFIALCSLKTGSLAIFSFQSFNLSSK